MKRLSFILVAIVAIMSCASWGFLVPHVSAEDTSCKVINAEFSPGMAGEIGTMDVLKPGKTLKDSDYFSSTNIDNTFLKDDNQRTVTVTVTTENCLSQKVLVSIVDDSSTGMTYNTDVDPNLWMYDQNAAPELGTPDAAVRNMEFIVPTTESFTITLQIGDSGCSDNPEGPRPMCRYHIIAGTKPFLGKLSGVPDGAYYSRGKPGGTLAYNCDGACDVFGVNWSMVSSTAVNQQQNNSVTLDSGATTLDPSTTCLDAAGNAIPGCYKVYDGLAGILDKLGQKTTIITGADSLGGFLNGVIALIIGIAGIATLIMIMYWGYQYGFSRKQGNVNQMDEAKKGIFKSVIGFLVVLSLYVIFYTINPDMLRLVPNISNITLLTTAEVSPADFKKITGEELGTPSQYDAMAKQIATQTGSDYCALRVIIQNETHGKASLIGQDENAPFDIASRRAFVNSGQKYSGATFTPDVSQITNRNLCNDATSSCIGTAPNPNSPTLGLDWRFSKGIGLTQITFFPSGYGSNYIANPANKNIAPSRTFNFSDGAMTVTPLEALKPETNLTIAAKLWKAGINQCGTPQGAFYTYACGACSCSGSFANKEVSERTSQYNQCKVQNP